MPGSREVSRRRTRGAARLSGRAADNIRFELRREPPPHTSAWRAKRRLWSRQLATEPPRAIIEIATRLVKHGLWARLTAYELIEAHAGAIDALNPRSVRQLAAGLADWPGVDTFGCLIAGPAWRERRIGTRQINSWAASADRWQRRLALVCTVALNVRARGGRGDSARTLRLCRRLVADRDEMVVKALSWALRALVQWDRDGVQRFLRDHAQKLAARIRREVGAKLRTGRKN
jgi:3-methyladenine DNA glycosylase AlkD